MKKLITLLLAMLAVHALGAPAPTPGLGIPYTECTIRIFNHTKSKMPIEFKFYDADGINLVNKSENEKCFKLFLGHYKDIILSNGGHYYSLLKPKDYISYKVFANGLELGTFKLYANYNNESIKCGYPSLTATIELIKPQEETLKLMSYTSDDMTPPNTQDSISKGWVMNNQQEWYFKPGMEEQDLQYLRVYHMRTPYNREGEEHARWTKLSSPHDEWKKGPFELCLILSDDKKDNTSQGDGRGGYGDGHRDGG